MTIDRILAMLALSACGGTAQPAPAKPQPQRIETPEVSLPIPAGYVDQTADMKRHIPGVGVALHKPADAGGKHQAVIVFEKAAIPGGAIDAASCAERGRAMVEDGPQLPGKPAKLRGTAAITWTGGTGCEFDYVTPDGIITLSAELHDAANTPEVPRDIWTMICQHDDGDAAAIATCRETRAGFTRK